MGNDFSVFFGLISHGYGLVMISDKDKRNWSRKISRRYLLGRQPLFND